MKRILFTLPAFLISILGISQNPFLLKDVFPGANSGTIQNIVKTTGYTFFNQDDNDADGFQSLFRTDGTNAGTVKIDLIAAGYTGLKVEKLNALANKVIFTGDNAVNYGELWVSDGTPGGTAPLEKFQPTTYNQAPIRELKAMNGYVYYSAVDNNNRAVLKRTDGTVAGTSLLYDFSAFAGVPQVVFLTPVNNILYFIVYDQGGTGFDQLWRSDGTNAGTYMVYNFSTGNFVQSFIMPAGNNMYILIGTFSAGIRTNTLWKSDGTAEGTGPLKVIGTNAVPGPVNNLYPAFASIGNTLYFAGLDGNGKELWQCDGTVAGTYMVADINPGAGSSNPLSLAVLNNQIFFSASNGTSGAELWKYSSGATSLVKDINPGAGNSGPTQLTISDNTIVFSANNGVNGGELWISDGTSANTVMVADINPGVANSVPNTFTPGNPVYFAANNGTNGFEVFKYDNNGDVLAGPRKFYVNDNSVTGDVLTLSVGNNSNNGSKAYPFATVTYALSQVQAGDTIYVDAGTYAEQVTIDKGITIIGAGQTLTSITNPGSPLLPPPGPFTEYALIQTAQNIGDVHISNLQTTNNPANDGHSILLQTGGSVKNCRIIDGSLGIYVRVESATKTVVVENNFIQSSVFAVACQGPGVTASVINNTLNLTNPGFSVGIWVGLDFGPVTKLTATGNAINNYVYRGIVGNSNNTVLSENSILGTGQYAIENTAAPAVATCNWYGSSDQYVVASKISGAVNFSPWLTNGTDNDLSSIGFQPVPGSCAGRQLFYVNDNSLTGDVFTTAVGNNANNGSPSAPLATITAALVKAQPGDIILVDAGSYTEIVNITKNVSILGAGKGVTILNGPAGPITPYPNTNETGIIQTLNGVTDVIIENLTLDGTNSAEQHGIFIQGGGRVSNCELRYVNDGFYFQYLSTDARTAVGNNNYVHHINYVGALFAGNGLNATATNNVIDLNGALYGMGFIAGYGGNGNVASFTASNNSIINFNGFGMTIGSIQPAQINNNSLTRIAGNYISNAHSVNAAATCNWFGTSDAAVIIPNITGAVSYTPWLSNGTDNDVAFGFQPLPNVCNGRQNKFYVNDNNQTGDRFTTAVGNNANPGIPSAPFGSIDYAYNLAQTGDTIFVDAGEYIYGGELFIAKGITFIGRNYDISPNDAADARNANASWIAESKITGGTLTILSNNLTFKGFTFNPGLRTAVSLNNTPTSNNNFGNLDFTNNRFIVTQASSQVILVGVGTGATAAAALINSGFTISNNRFEKSAAGGGSVFSVHLVKNVTITDNAFVIGTGGAVRTATALSMGNVGVVDNVSITNNTVDRFVTFVTGNQYANATITNNKVFNTTNALNINNSMPGASVVEISNNIFDGSTGVLPFVQYVRSGGNGAGSSTLFKAENNQSTVNAVPVTTTLLGAFLVQYNNIVQNPSAIIRGNTIIMGGDLSTVEGQFIRPINIRGNLGSMTVENNEITLSGTNLQPRNPANILSVCPAITLGTENGVNAVLQPSAVVNILNNKVHGFKQSFIVFDPAAGANPYVGFGNLPEGVTANVNNNSFTGDSISVNNGTGGGGNVNAACNWYGSATAQGIINKLVLAGNLDIIPWLTNGIDNDVATGFQPVPGSCDGYPTLIILNSSTNVTCNGAANGTINVTTSYGKAPFTYTWTKEGDANFVSNSEDLTGLAPGTYTLSILDGNGSNIYITDPEADGPGVITVVITEPDVLTASADGDNNICFNGTIGSASVTPAGGTAPYSYLWSNGGTTNEITNLAAGVYNVTVTDANGCTTTASYEVTQPTQVTASITNSSTACSNIATVTAGDGTPGYSYLWSNGSTSATISGVPVGTYSVVVTDANGCTATASVNLTVGEAFNPSASVTNINCFGANNGIITVTNVNGTAPFMFSKDGGVTFVNGTLPFSFTGLAPGTYTIAVKDANGCVGFVERTVTQPTQLTPIISSVVSSCFGQSTGAVTVTVTGGTPAYTYSWSKEGGGFSSSQLNISGVAAGNYTLTVTDKNGCTALLPVAVPSNNEIMVNAIITNVLCRNTATGAINLSVTGGTGAGFTYSWTGALISSNEDLNNIGAANNYNVRITDIGSGCFVDRSYQVTQPAALTISTTGTNATGCNSLGTITATAGGGVGNYQYSINGGSYQTSNVFSGLYAGTYTVTVRDGNGCTTNAAARSITDNGGDQYESNNSRTNSKPISIGTTINARLATAADVADWFVITTPAGGGSVLYSLVVSNPTPGISYTFDIYPASPNNAAALTPAGVIGTARKDYTLNPGTSYRIGVTTTTLSFICYNLSVSPLVPVTSINNSTKPQFEMKATITADVLSSKVYPNPHRGSFTLSIESPEDGIGTVEMFNANGQLLGERKVNLVKGKGNVVQYNNMNHAVLFYRVHIGKHIVNGKIIGAN